VLGEKYFEQQYTVLDVGCGSNPSGDVNCDLFTKDVGHRCQNNRTFDYKKIKNFVLCDIQCLPFRDGVFEKVYSRYALEHIENPCRCLDEMVRVSSDNVTVLVPHRYGDRLFFWHLNPYHISFFNKKWFFRYIHKRKLFGFVEYSNYKVFLFFLTIPSELRLTLRKLIKY